MSFRKADLVESGPRQKVPVTVLYGSRCEEKRAPAIPDPFHTRTLYERNTSS